MANFEIVRVEKLKTMACVKRSALHTFREIEVKNAVTEKFSDNHFELKSAEEVYQAVRDRIEKIDKKDKQAVRCVEFFVGASPEVFEPGGRLETRQAQDKYFSDALEWIKEKHGSENVVCHAVHRDEKSPHLIVYVVPVEQVKEKIRKRSVGLKGGKVGERRLIEEVVPAHSELSCKAYYGNPNAFQKLQDNFHAAVGMENGLDRGISRVEGRNHKETSQWYEEQRIDIENKKKALAAREAAVSGKEIELNQLAKKLVDDRNDLDHKNQRILDLIQTRLDDLVARESAVENKNRELEKGLAKLADDRKTLEKQEAVDAEFRKKFTDAYALLPMVEKVKIHPDLEKIGILKKKTPGQGQGM